jgi:microcystin-dependent protein
MTAYMGTVCAFGFNFAPVNWAFCAGQLLSISEYTALYSLLGTTYGGDGQTTFGVPNLQDRTIVHMGQGSGTNNYVIGASGGTNSVTLNLSNMAAHTHPVSFQLKANSTAGTTAAPNNYPATAASGTPYATTANAFMGAPNPQPTLANTGGSQPISIQSPSLAINYCIALFGIYPQRS